MVGEILNNNEIIAVAGTVVVGLIIRFLYDFWVKPMFKKSKTHLSPKQLKQLIKNSSESTDDFHLLLKYLSSCENSVQKSYYSKLKHFDKPNLSEEEVDHFEDTLKDLKKHCK